MLLSADQHPVADRHGRGDHALAHVVGREELEFPVHTGHQDHAVFSGSKHFAIGDDNSRQEKIRRILTTVGLDADVLQRYPHQFSSGQQQRIAVARALVTDPELLIADEAVSALDVSVQAQILQLFQNLQKERGIAFLFISHDLAVIRQIAHQVAIIYRGQLLEHTSADSFFGGPAHAYSKSLLDSAA